MKIKIPGEQRLTIEEVRKNKMVQRVLKKAFPGSSKKVRAIALEEAHNAVQVAVSQMDEFEEALLTPTAHGVMLALYLTGIARGAGSWPPRKLMT
jgi:phosphoenolpyruvate synthase/pyruvate phosphate dikinase